LSTQLPEKQYVWTAVSARAKAKGWTDIELLLTAKVNYLQELAENVITA